MALELWMAGGMLFIAFGFTASTVYHALLLRTHYRVSQDEHKAITHYYMTLAENKTPPTTNIKVELKREPQQYAEDED
jgi:hypothetical protein